MSWIGNGIIPNIDWLKWSYGAPEPDGFFVVPALLQRFRQERSHSAICRGAGISLSTLIDYRKRAEEALTVALKGDLSALARVPCCASWMGGRETACSAWRSRRRCMPPAEGPTTRKQKERFKGSTNRSATARRWACAELEEFLCSNSAVSHMQRDRFGLRGHLFIPPPLLEGFRRRSIENGGKGVFAASSRLPPTGFNEWFLEWTIPAAYRGKRLTLLASRRRGLEAAAPKTSSGHVPPAIPSISTPAKPKRAPG